MRQIVGKYQSSRIGVLNYVTHCACLVIADYYVFAAVYIIGIY